MKLKFSLKAWAKLNYLMHKGPTEVGGYGILSDTKDELEVVDFKLVEQESTAASVSFTDDGFDAYMEEMFDSGLQPEQFNRVWIHTHPGSSAKPSGTDEKSWSGDFKEFSWHAMFIIARGGETYARMMFRHPFGAMQLEIDHEVDYSLPYPKDEDRAEWDAEYERCVKKPAPTVFQTTPKGKPKYVRTYDDYDEYKSLVVGCHDDPTLPESTPSDLPAKISDRDWIYIDDKGLWQHSPAACMHLARSRTYLELDGTDWELIHWYMKEQHVDVEDTPELELWKAFKDDFCDFVGGKNET